MTTELFWLTASALLAATLWVPYIVGVNTTPAPGARDVTQPPDMSKFVPWVQRANRAHLNMIETLVPFAIVVLIAHVAEVSSPVTIAACIAFFWLRVAHAVGMISGLAGLPLRPILFTLSWACTMAVGAAVSLA